MQKVNSLSIKPKQTVKQDYWRDHIERWEKSALSQQLRALIRALVLISES